MPLEMPKVEDDAEASINRLEDLVGYHLRRASVFDLQGAVPALDPAKTRPVPMSVLLSIVEMPGISSAWQKSRAESRIGWSTSRTA